MRKTVLLVFIFVFLLSGCRSSVINHDADSTFLAYDDVSAFLSIEDIMNKADFIAKASFIREEFYLDESESRYTFEVIKDFFGNMEFLNEDGEIYVYGQSGLFENGNSYYLFLDGSLNIKTGITRYLLVDSSSIIQSGNLLSGRIEYSNKGLADIQQLNTAGKLEEAIAEHVNENKAAIVAASEALATPEINSVTEAIAAADTVIKVVFKEGYPANLEFSVVDYTVVDVLKGNTDLDNRTYSQMIPTELTEYDSYYYMLQREEWNENGYYSYHALCSDYWLIPVSSDDGAVIAAYFDTE